MAGMIECVKIGRQFRNKPLFINDGKVFICFSGDLILGYEINAFSQIFEFKENNERISCVTSFKNSENLLISCTKEGTISVWDIESKSIVHKYKVNKKIYQIFPKDSSNSFLVVSGRDKKGEKKHKHVPIKKSKAQYTVSSVIIPTIATKEPLNFKHLARVAYCAPNYIAYSFKQSLLVNLFNESFKFFNIKENGDSGCVQSSSSFSCVSIHPELPICATGCTNGNILLWNLTYDPITPYTQLHWHSSAVTDVCFNYDGYYLYSGGKENVFVCWTIETREKLFIPRLESSIKNIVSSKSMICLVHVNNEITFIDSLNLHIIKKITNFQRNSNPYLPLTYDKESHCLVFGPKAGSLSFYSPVSSNVVYTMPVVHQNFIGLTDRNSLFQYEITNLCFSKSKKWMYTIEQSIKNDFIRLKAWYYSKKSECYKLANSIESPHLLKVQDLASHCFDFNQQLDYVVTCANDKLIKVWKTQSMSFVSPKGVQRYGLEYNLSYSYHHSSNPSVLQFSCDGSILAAIYDNSIVIFSFPFMHLQYVLPFTSPKYLVFGNESSSTYMAIASDTYITVYDLLTMTPIWCKAKKIFALLADPYTSYFCLIIQSNTETVDFLIYSFHQSTPIQILRDVSPYKQKVLSAVFGQPLKKSLDDFYLGACLYFMVESHDIYSLSSDIKNSAPLNMVNNVNEPSTILSSTKTATFESSSSTSAPPKNYLSNIFALNQEKDFSQKIHLTPTHLLPNPSLLLSQYFNVILSNYKLSDEISSSKSDTTPQTFTHMTISSDVQDPLPDLLKFKSNPSSSSLHADINSLNFEDIIFSYNLTASQSL